MMLQDPSCPMANGCVLIYLLRGLAFRFGYQLYGVGTSPFHFLREYPDYHTGPQVFVTELRDLKLYSQTGI